MLVLGHWHDVNAGVHSLVLGHKSQHSMVNKFPQELASRVLHFAEHKLKQQRGGMKRPAALNLLPGQGWSFPCVCEDVPINGKCHF